MMRWMSRSGCGDAHGLSSAGSVGGRFTHEQEDDGDEEDGNTSKVNKE